MTENTPPTELTELQKLVKKADFEEIKKFVNANDKKFRDRYTFYCDGVDKFDFKNRKEDSVIFLAIDLPEKTKFQDEIIALLREKKAEVYEYETVWLECYDEKVKMEKRIQELQPQIDEINRKVNEKKGDYEKSLKTLENEYNDLKAKNDRIVAENDSLDREIASLEKQYQEKIDAGKAELHRKENDEIIPKLTKQKARIDELESKIRAKEIETEKIKQEIQIIEADKAYFIWFKKTNLT